MRLLQDKSRPGGDGLLHGQEDAIGEADGWDSLEITRRDSSEDSKIISIVNENIPLFVVLKKYNIIFETQYSHSGWTHRCKCPFKDHNDKWPSFGYNPQKGCFNCFGCNRGGKSVQFIAYMEDLNPIEVARTLIDEIAYVNNDLNDKESINNKELDKLLFDYASCVYEFKNQHKTECANKYAEAVTWNLDVYLRKNVISGSIVLGDLKLRIKKLKEQLNVFKGDE